MTRFGWRSRTLVLAGVAALCLPGAAVAHHSFAMFDQQKKITLTGVVGDFEWTNPHALLHVIVPGEAGAEEEWWVEMQSLGRIARGGWRRDTVKPGDKITVEIHPLKDGSAGGAFIYAVTGDGRRLGQTGGGFDLPAPGGDEEGLKQAEREDAVFRSRQQNPP